MSKLTVEFPNGEKGEFVHAYGLTFNSKMLDRLSTRDLKSHIDNIRTLEIRDDDVYLATYPKCGKDPVREIKKINSFLETGRSEDLIKRIAEACDFKNLKKADADIKLAEFFMDKKKRSNLYRKGEVGDWKNHYTVAQNERMNEWLEENFTDTDLKFRYKL